MENNLINKGTSLRVLILEDSLLDLELMSEQLTGAGYEVDVTHVEAEAEFKTALLTQKFDVILSDFRLPGFDAFAALDICLEICPEVPFICVSGSIGEETAIELLKNGADDYVLKDRPGRLPFSVQRSLKGAEEKTLRLKTNRELKESEQRFRQVALTAQEWIWQVDSNGLYTYSSPVVESILGYTPEELTGKIFFYDLYPPEQKEALKQAAFKVFENRGLFEKFINPHVHKNGKLVYISTSGSPVFDEEGNFRGYQGADEDITERLEAEENLKLLNRAVEASSVSVTITDAEGKIIYVNPFYTQLKGYSKEETIGQRPRFLSTDDQPDVFYEVLWNTINSGKDWNGEFQNKKKNGRTYWERAVISPLLNRQNKVTNFVIIEEDVTERKKMTEELVRAKEKAEESDRLKTAFINNISHEIRTPLNGILGFGHMMAEYDISLEKRREYFKYINQSSERLLNTITDFMDMAMIVSRTMEMNKEEFALAPVFESLTEKMIPLCLERNLDFKMETPPEHKDLIVYSNSEFIKKILNKLLDNALKFTRKGSITCGYSIDPKQIKFFVKDTGSGIEKSKLETIFKIFNQEDVSMTREYEGSGLGLSIAKAMARLLDGDINVTSKKGKGSEFILTIPNNTHTVHALNNHTKFYGEDKPLVLVAEDEKLNFLVIKALLDSLDYNYIRAVNGLVAVDYCKYHPNISLVLMDIQMPVMNGIEATKEIRKFRPDLPIIATTAYAQTGDRIKFLKAGCNDYISKPIKRKKLLEVFSNYIDS